MGESLSVTAGQCYEFVITDDWGDGMWEVFLDGVSVASGKEFGKSETALFGECVLSPPTPSPVDPPVENPNLEINVKTDDFPEDTSWKLTQLFPNVEGVEIATGGNYTDKNNLYSKPLEVDPNGCFQFTFNDSFEDGIKDGYYQVVLNGVEVLRGEGESIGAGGVWQFGSCN